jgi:hypothetical protein
VTAGQLLTPLTYPPLVRFLQRPAAQSEGNPREAKYFEEDRLNVETLLRAMASKAGAFDGILAAIGNRVLGTPHTEREASFLRQRCRPIFLTACRCAERFEDPIAPFELRTVFARGRMSQLLMMEGQPPAAAMRLRHEDVAAIREQMLQQAERSRA